MTCLAPEWATVIQDQVDTAKALDELLMVAVMHNYPLIAMRMWALHEEHPPGQTFFQHFNRKLELVEFTQLKELVQNRCKTAFFLSYFHNKG